MPITLIPPSPAYAAQVMAYRAEMLAIGDSLDGCAGLEDVRSYEEWADLEGRLKRKYGEGYVPSRVYLAVRLEDDRLVGIMEYRHPLTPFLLRCGGNIGYSVRPSERRKGYAGEMLRRLLAICRADGVGRLLLTCDRDNEASRRTIVKNSGLLENEMPDDVGLGHSGVIQRYWISL